MNMQAERNIQQWVQDMKDQRSSGLSQQAWCQAHGINLNTYQYRCKRVRRAMSRTGCEQKPPQEDLPLCANTAEPVFAKVSLIAPPAPVSGIHIQTDTARIHIAPDAQVEQIRVIWEACLYAK